MNVNPDIDIAYENMKTLLSWESWICTFCSKEYLSELYIVIHAYYSTVSKEVASYIDALGYNFKWTIGHTKLIWIEMFYA